MKGICLQCGAEFKNRRALDFRKKNPQQTVCSRKCWREYRRALMPVCSVCGRNHNGTEDKCCDCTRKAKQEKALNKTCQICGKEFVAMSVQTVRCSRECDKENARRKATERATMLHNATARPTQCKWCGEIFTPEYGSKKRVYCSDECGKKSGRESMKVAKRKRKYAELARADNDCYYNPISLKRLYDRDGGKCGICGKKVDWSLQRSGKQGPHPMCATRDHIIPVSCGGAHTWNNVRLAHMTCNIVRGTGGNAQTLLFG